MYIMAPFKNVVWHSRPSAEDGGPTRNGMGSRDVLVAEPGLQ
jgi:hypothetical protein